MMQLNTIRQILEVLQGFNKNYSEGTSLKRSYQMAVQRVADSEGVTYQTIGDACRRRLCLNSISEFYEILRQWTDGDPTELIGQLKKNTNSNYHAEIDSFFGDSSHRPHKNRFPTNGGSVAESKSEVFSLRLPEKEARMLKALAEIEGSSVAGYLAEIVTDSVKHQMKKFAAEVMRED